MKAAHIQLGIDGELLAVNFLKEKGYQILQQNWRASHAEIDIIAQIGNDLVFVEVKTRSSNLIFPEKAVTKAKQKLLVKAANSYCDEFKITSEIRFDIIAIIQAKNKALEIEHFEDAFFPYDDNYSIDFDTD